MVTDEALNREGKSRVFLAPASLRRYLASSFFWTILGNGLYAGSQWLVLVYLTRHVTTALVGEYSLALSVSAPILLLTNLSLRTVVVSLPVNEGNDTAFWYLRLGLTAIGAAAVIGAAVLLNVDQWIIAGICAAKAVDSVSDILMGFSQRVGRNKDIGTANAVNGFITLTSFIGIFELTASFRLAVLGSVAGSLVSLLVIAQRQRLAGVSVQSIVGSMPSIRKAVNLLSIAWPLGLAASLASLLVNMPRFVISESLGVDRLAVFAAMTYVVYIANLFAGALAQPLLPVFVSHFANGKNDAVRLVVFRLCAACSVVGIVLIAVSAFLGEMLLTLMYGPAYASGNVAFTILIASVSFTLINWFLDYAASAAHQFRFQLLTTTAALLVQLVCLATLVPTMGINGAAISILAATVIQVLGRAIVVFRVTGPAVRVSQAGGVS